MSYLDLRRRMKPRIIRLSSSSSRSTELNFRDCQVFLMGQNDKDIGDLENRSSCGVEKIGEIHSRKASGSLGNVVANAQGGGAELFSKSEFSLLRPCVRHRERAAKTQQPFARSPNPET